MAFEDEKACKRFLASICMDGNVYKMWTCEHCQLVHHLCYPKEITGATSGKDVRKVSFYERFEQ